MSENKKKTPKTSKLETPIVYQGDYESASFPGISQVASEILDTKSHDETFAYLTNLFHKVMVATAMRTGINGTTFSFDTELGELSFKYQVTDLFKKEFDIDKISEQLDEMEESSPDVEPTDKKDDLAGYS